ncbi:MAG TPA: glucan biosynthesis protein [Gemmataceae bacterium]|nr:glucan biosynthesis protein [Gemmataceae bacterium]
MPRPYTQIGAAIAWLLVFAASAPAGAKEERIDFDSVKRKAEALARQQYEHPAPLPKILAKLNYDQYRLIAVRHERAFWRDGLPFRLELLHRGFMAKDKMNLSLVKNGRAERLPYDPGLFQYRGEMANLKSDPTWGYSGFRLLCKLASWSQFQEFCLFQGASYFRAICDDQVYGTSARGLAVDIGMSRPEEFPIFRDFWLERPAADAQSVRAWALLDGPSVTGAYQFVITPGVKETTLDIDCELHFRRPVEKLGIAPMSSMWSSPDMHDADGLLMAGTDGEWLWRPLARRDGKNVSRFEWAGLRGFGLMQRDRDPKNYADNGTQYESRPSVWIMPRTPWGEGAVELLEFRSDVEWVDNIAAWWVPKRPVKKGERMTLAYRVAFTAAEKEDAGGRFIRTSRSEDKGGVSFALTCTSKALRAMDAKAALTPVVTSSTGRIAEATCTKLPDGNWELRFRLIRDGGRPSELRAHVRRQKDVLTETWSFLCPQK